MVAVPHPTPVLDPAIRPNPTRLFGMMEGLPVSNLLGMGDPDVHLVGDQWWMYFGGFHTGFKNNLFSASLPPGASLGSDEWEITTSDNHPRRAAPLVGQPPTTSWDARGLHTPSYVSGIDPNAGTAGSRCERIYYAGHNSTSIIDNVRPTSIGVVERTPRGWARRPEPVLRGTSQYPSVLEPKARYFEGRWRIWYAATPKVAGKKTPPVYQIRYVESVDGITNWSEPRVLFSADDGYFDAVVSPTDGAYEAIVCRSGNLAGRSDFPAQGLWWLSADVPSGNRADWSRDPVKILDPERGSPKWYANGVLGPSLQYGNTVGDRDTMYVFFTGVHGETNWLRAAYQKLMTLQRPPFPSPFYLSIGRAQYVRT